MADESQKEVEQQLKKRNISKDKDVVEVYLGHRDLETVQDLNRFKNLQRVWLNGNKLRRLNCFRSNFQLTEVYLQDNLLLDINGALHHLRCLEVLMLNGNQLTKLTDVVHEFRAMQKLRDLNLFGNPLFQEYDYRLYVIHHIPSLEVLDRKEILKSERDKAFKKYEPHSDMVNETISFGRCVEGPPPKAYYPPSTAATVYNPDLDNNKFQLRDEDFISESEYSSNEKEASTEAAIDKRSLQRSIVQYSTFDWSTVPLSEEKRLSRGETKQPRILTVRFR